MPKPTSRKRARRKLSHRARANAALKAKDPKFAKLLNARLMDFFLSSDVPRVKRLVERILWLVRAQGLSTSRYSARKLKHLQALLLNLYVAYAADKRRYVAISMARNEYSRRSRYLPRWRSHAITKRLVDCLQDSGFIEVKRGFLDRARKKGFQTRIRATQALAGEFEKSGLRPYMVGRSSEFELVQLKDADKQLVDYRDSEVTEEMRQQLREFNQRIASSFVGLEVSDAKLAELQITSRGYDTDERVDFSDRTLYRVFNDGSFERGGRFFGGWWQSVPSQFRKHLCISDGPDCLRAQTVEVDFSSMQPSLAYTLQDLTPPKSIYAVPGYSRKELKLLKPILKNAMLRMLNTASRLAALESLKKYYRDEKIKGQPSPEVVLRLLEARHAPIGDLLYKEMGKKLMYLESRIAARIMTAMGEAGALVLPIHDSFIVISRHRTRLMREMRKAFKALTGHKCAITEAETMGQFYADRVSRAQSRKTRATLRRRKETLKARLKDALRRKRDPLTMAQLISEAERLDAAEKLATQSPDLAALHLIGADKKAAQRFWLDYLAWRSEHCPPAAGAASAT